MKTQKTSLHSNKSILPFCKDNIPFQAKFALLSFTGLVIPRPVEIILLYIEYMQLISQALLINSNLYSISSTPSTLTHDFLLEFVMIFSPGSLLDFVNLETSTVIVIVGLLASITFLKYVLLLYVVITAKKGIVGNKVMLTLWSFIFKTQSRVGYYFITSFWTHTLLILSQRELTLGSSLSSTVTIFCIMGIILEFILALGSQTLFIYRLPVKKSFFSSKDTHIETFTLSQKLILQLLDILAVINGASIIWISVVINIIISLIRIIHFYQRLPYFKATALYAYSVLLTVVMCMSIVYPLEIALRPDEKVDIMDRNFILITWLIVSIIGAKLAIGYLNRVLLELIISKKNRRPEMLVHKIIAIKYLLKNNYLSTEIVSNCKWEQLLATSIEANAEDMFTLKSDITANIKSKEFLKKAFVAYLEKLSQDQPKDSYIKLYLANYYGKKLNEYTMSMQILTGLQHSSPSRNTNLNIMFLMQSIQENIMNYSSQSEHIDLATYIKTITKVAELKESILEQAGLQIQLCEQIDADVPDLPAIWNITRKVNDLSRTSKKKAKTILNNISSSYLEPVALYAYYSLVLNHSVNSFQKYCKEYDTRLNKSRFNFTSERLSQKNAYQRDNGIFVLSGHKEDMLTIVYCSQSTQRMFDRKLVGEKISSLIIPSLQNQHYQNMRSMLEKGDPEILGKSTRVFQYMREGYIELYDYFINMSPFLTNGLYYFLITRKVPTTKDYIILNEDGTVDCCTREIGYQLGFLPRSRGQTKNSVHIEEISRELGKVSKSCSIAAFPEKYKEHVNDSDTDSDMYNTEEFMKTMVSMKKQAHNKAKTFTEAEKNFSQYTLKGKTVSLRSLTDPTTTFSYHCKIENQMHSSVLIKVLSLEKIGCEQPMAKNETQNVIVPTSPSMSIMKNRNARINTENEDLLVKKTESSRQLKLRSQALKKQGTLNSINFSKQDIIGDRHSVSTYVSNSVEHLKVSKAFSKAIKTKYYSAFYKVFVVVWYLLLVGMIANQIQLSLNRETEIQSLGQKKTVLRSAHMQVDSLIALHMKLRSLWGLVNSASPLSNDSKISIEFMYNQAISEIERLKENDKNLLAGTWLLDDDDRDLAFTDNVKLFEARSEDRYINVNIFHAVDQLIEKSSIGLAQSKESGFVDLPDLDFVFRNDLDDVRAKTEEAAHMFLHDIEKYNEEIHSSLGANNAITLSLIVVTALIFVCIVYLQYRNETKNMLSFIKLDPRGVSTVQQRIITFKRNIENDIHPEDLLGIDVINYLDELYFRGRTLSSPKIRSINRDTSSAGYKGVSKKFYLFVFVTIPLFVITMVLIYINHIMVDKSIESTEKQLSQLIFSDDLKIDTSLVLTTLLDLMVDPNSATYVENEPISLEVLEEINEIDYIITETLSELKQEDGQYGSEIADLLFKDSCLDIEEQWKNDCIEMRNKAQITGVINLLNDLSAFVQDTSTRIVNNASLPDLQESISQNLVARAIFASVSLSIDNNLVKNMDDSVVENYTVNAVIIVSLVIVCMVVRLGVLKKLGESDNDFKKMLKTFPAPLVLSNPLIKVFLERTSKVSMSSIRNNI